MCFTENVFIKSQNEIETISDANYLNNNLLKSSKSKKNISHFAPKKRLRDDFEEPSLLTTIMAYGSLCLLILSGFVKRFMLDLQGVNADSHCADFPNLLSFKDRTYQLIHIRMKKIFYFRPICSVPGDTVLLKERINFNGEFTGEETRCINFGSYNYLGFSENSGPCAEASKNSIKDRGMVTSSSRQEFGTNTLHQQLESLVAKFLDVEDAIVFGMGFATNSLNIPTLLSPGCLVLSDRKNHASIIAGLRLSGATIKVFKHNDIEDLEKILMQSIVVGQRNGSPWKKILIVVEGVYSMDGSIVKLPEIVALKKKYKAYIYLDEAHSIGALGPRGRGVTDYFGLDPKDIDVLMGRTKSFGSAGGYIAGSKKLIKFLRVNSHAQCYASSMAPSVTQQILTSMKIIMGLDGTDEGRKRIEKLARNTKYFRRRLSQIGVIVYGHEDSPVVPMLTFFISKMCFVAKELKKRKIASVMVCFPIVEFSKARIRFCMSSAHSKEQIDYLLDQISELADQVGLKYSKQISSNGFIEY